MSLIFWNNVFALNFCAVAYSGQFFCEGKQQRPIIPIVASFVDLGGAADRPFFKIYRNLKVFWKRTFFPQIADVVDYTNLATVRFTTFSLAPPSWDNHIKANRGSGKRVQLRLSPCCMLMNPYLSVHAHFWQGFLYVHRHVSQISKLPSRQVVRSRRLCLAPKGQCRPKTNMTTTSPPHICITFCVLFT